MEIDKSISAVYDLTGSPNGEQRMSEKEKLLEHLIWELNFSFNICLGKPAKKSLHHSLTLDKRADSIYILAHRLSEWIQNQYQITDCQIESKNENSFLRLYLQTSILDVRYELEDGYRYAIPLYDLLNTMQSFCKDDWPNKERINILLSFLQRNLFHDVETKKNVQVIQIALHLLMTGISSYASFGQWILEQLFPANTYMLDVVNSNVILVDFLLYQYHNHALQTTNPLFCIEEMGWNGFNVLYDDTFILKCRIRQKTKQLDSLCCYFYIERKDKQSYLF